MNSPLPRIPSPILGPVRSPPFSPRYYSAPTPAPTPRTPSKYAMNVSEVLVPCSSSDDSSDEGCTIELPLHPELGHHPCLTFHFPASSTQHAEYAVMLVFRGGGYGTCQGSGVGAAAWLAKHDVIGVEVEYRTTGQSPQSAPWEGTHTGFYPGEGGAMRDAERAAFIVRELALDRSMRQELGVPCRLSRSKIGAMGFSAGGHLASMIATPVPSSGAQGVPCESAWRPDRLVLCYPVISLANEAGLMHC